MRDWELHLGDALDVLPGMPDGSADVVVTDPPAGINFMGSKWDSFGGRCNGNAARDRAAAHQGPGAGNGNQPFAYSGSALPRAGERTAFLAFLTPVMAECLRVLKPGGYALVWALPRTSHWTATALEDSGFEIRDVIVHLQSQGFPKGKGCLKPAAEHWILCRRPGPRVLPLNIDECRIPIAGTEDIAAGGYHVPGKGASRNCYTLPGNGHAAEVPHPDSPRHDARGRWPTNLVLSHHESCVCRGTKRVANRATPYTRSVPATNEVYGAGFGAKAAGEEPTTYAGPDGTEEVEDWVCHPECPVFLLDSQVGHLHAPVSNGADEGAGVCYGGGWAGRPGKRPSYTDSGPPSRFFYVAKADRADRGDGNDHPCTKSTALMQWLCKLVSRPGETVLDPFAGSGSTGVAALRCERRFVGVERDAHYHGIALKRLAAVDGPLFARLAGEAAP